MARSAPKKTETEVVITAPRMAVAKFSIVGEAPLMVAKFSTKAKNKIEADHRAGGAAKTKKNREARNFEADTEAARHISAEGWDGVAAAAFRNAMIDACRAAGFVMTRAKLAVFCVADGNDAEDGTPLVRIHSKKAFEQSIMPVRNASGVMDLRARPLWREWSMTVTLRFDQDILSLENITNLLLRVGMQVGIGEGRPYGREGNGMGFGLFRLEKVRQIASPERTAPIAELVAA
jgi:hypothetical protein